jgi:hypothetical protein
VVAIVVSALVALAGLYLVLGGTAEGMTLIGWMLLVVGAAGVVGNLYLRSRGIRPPRRRS